jgi:hypothetical protein
LSCPEQNCGKVRKQNKNGGKVRKQEDLDETNREYFKVKVKYSSLNGSHSHRLLIDKW